MDTCELVAEFLEHCEGYLGLRPQTLVNYTWGLGYLCRMFEELPLDAQDLERVVSVKHLSLTSKKNLKRIIGRFYGWASKRKKFPNPVPDMEKLPREKSLPRVLSDIEVRALGQAAQTRRDQALVALPLNNGIRVGEMSNMVEEDIGPDYMFARGKVGRRRLPLSPNARRRLLNLGDGQHVWLGQSGRPMTTWGIQQVYQRLYARAGITGRKLGPHTLRHTFGTLYVREGGNLRKLQEIMGHESIQTTEIYVHLAGLDVKEDHERYNPFNTLGLEELWAA